MIFFMVMKLFHIIFIKKKEIIKIYNHKSFFL